MITSLTTFQCQESAETKVCDAVIPVTLLGKVFFYLKLLSQDVMGNNKLMRYYYLSIPCENLRKFPPSSERHFSLQDDSAASKFFLKKEEEEKKPNKKPLSL